MEILVSRSRIFRINLRDGFGKNFGEVRKVILIFVNVL